MIVRVVMVAAVALVDWGRGMVVAIVLRDVAVWS